MREIFIGQVDGVMAQIVWDGISLTPQIYFNDGSETEALPRLDIETQVFGYDDVALGNFEHEALHLFVMHKLGLTEQSVLWHSAHGVAFTGDVLRMAIAEEALVVGLQAAIQDVQRCDKNGNTVIPGFCFHVARAAYNNAKHLFANQGFDIDELAAEARLIIRGELDFCRVPCTMCTF